MKKVIIFALLGLLAVITTACHAFQPYTAPDGSTGYELTPQAEYVVQKTLEKGAESDGLLGWIATAGLGVFNLYQYRKNRRKGKTASVAVAGTSLILDAVKSSAEKQKEAPTYEELIEILKAYQEATNAREDIREVLKNQKNA